MSSNLTLENIETAREMRAKGIAWDVIAMKLCTTRHFLMCALIPSYREFRRQQNYAAWARKSLSNIKQPTQTIERPDGMAAHDKYIRSHDRVQHLVPKSVLIERDKRLLQAPRDLTAALQGDPLPGRSALDMRQNDRPT